MEHITWHGILHCLEHKGNFQKFLTVIHQGFQKAKVLKSPPSIRDLLLLDNAGPMPPASIKEVDPFDESDTRSGPAQEVESLRAELEKAKDSRKMEEARYAAEREDLLRKQEVFLLEVQRKAKEDAQLFIEEAVRKTREQTTEALEAEKKKAKQLENEARAAREASQYAEETFMQKTIEAFNLEDDGFELSEPGTFGTFIKALKYHKSRSMTPSVAPSFRKSLTPFVTSPLSTSPLPVGIFDLQDIENPCQGSPFCFRIILVFHSFSSGIYFRCLLYIFP